MDEPEPHPRAECGRAIRHRPGRPQRGKGLDAVRVADPEQARAKILRQLGVYRAAAPNYEVVTALVDGVFDRLGPERRLRDLNVLGLAAVAERLGLAFSAVSHAGQWALEICDQLGATA